MRMLGDNTKNEGKKTHIKKNTKKKHCCKKQQCFNKPSTFSFGQMRKKLLARARFELTTYGL